MFYLKSIIKLLIITQKWKQVTKFTMFRWCQLLQRCALMFSTQWKPIDSKIKVYHFTCRPFCGRVTPHDSLGLVPTKKFDQHEVRKSNHYNMFRSSASAQQSQKMVSRIPEKSSRSKTKRRSLKTKIDRKIIEDKIIRNKTKINV